MIKNYSIFYWKKKLGFSGDLYNNNISVSIIISFLLFFSINVFGQINSTITFYSTGTWTAPAGVTSVTVTCIGSGGAGGRSYTNNGGAGGGGAGGACVISALAVIAGTTYNITVGASKTSDVATNGPASNTGNPSWFNTAGTIYAEGGSGGTGVSTASAGAKGTGSTASSIGTTKYAGGNGTIGNVTSGTTGGSGGGGAGTTGVGGNAVTGTGGTGTSLNGGNGANGVADNTVGSDGFNYGGGGSGGKRTNDGTSRTGGAGAQGLVTITYVVNNAIFSGGNSDGFSMTRIGSSGGEVTLPVELLSFNANPNKEIVDVTWSTASEFNSDYFLVERSQSGLFIADDVSFIAQVNAYGNSSTTKKYSSKDCNPYCGVSYYRLKEVDNDGKFQYSNVVSVHFDNNINDMSVFPNPTSGLFNIQFAGETGKQVLIVVRDIHGRDLYSKVFLSSEKQEVFAIDPYGKLKPGLYFIYASSDNKVFEKKVVIK